MKKILKIILSLIMTLSLITGCTNKNNDNLADLYDYYNQSYTIDDYTISLVKSIYDPNTRLGYIQFEVKNKYGSVESDNYYNGIFGEDDRFTLKTAECETFKIKKHGNGLILIDKVTDISKLKNKKELQTTLYDNQGKSGKDRIYKFEIKNTEHIYQYEIDDDITLNICPLGLEVTKNNCSNCGYIKMDIKIILNNGDVYKYKGDMAGSGYESTINDHGTYDAMTRYIFKKTIDITKIAKIKYTIDDLSGTLE